LNRNDDLSLGLSTVIPGEPGAGEAELEE